VLGRFSRCGPAWRAAAAARAETDRKGRRRSGAFVVSSAGDLLRVVSDEIEQVIEFFNTPAAAEAMLEEVLRDEPDWRDVLYIEPSNS
jgi:hypothetical protein